MSRSEGKNFLPKSQLYDLTQKFRIEHGARCFKDGDKRHHKSDGLIFQPDAPYKMSTGTSVLAILHYFTIEHNCSTHIWHTVTIMATNTSFF